MDPNPADDAWERAVEAAIDAAAGAAPPRSLMLDGAVKCLHGRLPAPAILERLESLEHLSIAGVGLSSLAGFPRLRRLTRLSLSDNRIASGLEHLVSAGLYSLRDLDLSNNRIQGIDDLSPLFHLRLVSLDLYECPVTRVKDYRARVFSLIRTLKYLDKMDADGNERLESDDDDDDDDGNDEDGEEEDDDEDPGSGEVDGEESLGRRNANGFDRNGVIDADEDESDADEEGLAAPVQEVGTIDTQSNGFCVASSSRPRRISEADADDEDEEEEDVEDEDEQYYEVDLCEEIDEDFEDYQDEDEDEDVVEGQEGQEVAGSEEEGDGVEEDGSQGLDGQQAVEDNEIANGYGIRADDDDDDEPACTGRRGAAEGEIDAHEQGEEDDDENDGNGEIGEDERQEIEDHYFGGGVGDEDDDEDDDEEGMEYVVQPIIHPQSRQTVASNGSGNINTDEDCDEEDEVDDDDEDIHGKINDQPSSSQSAAAAASSRKRGGNNRPDNLDLDGDADDGVDDFRSVKRR